MHEISLCARDMCTRYEISRYLLESHLDLLTSEHLHFVGRVISSRNSPQKLTLPFDPSAMQGWETTPALSS